MAIASSLEKQNLEAHVDLCHQRYLVIEDKIDTIQKNQTELLSDIKSLREEITKSSATSTKVFVGATATIVSGLLGVIVVLLIAFVN